MNHPVIIGAGGVASYLIPVLLKSFKPKAVTLVDADRLEERNLDRQLFRKDQIGQYKAEALMRLYPQGEWGAKWYIIKQWFDASTKLHEEVDAIICCADNHMARYAAMRVADDIGCMAYIGGNEFLDSQAFCYYRSWRGTKRDPVIRWPSIATDEEGSPFRCQGEAMVSSPQLAVANLNCAGKILHLAWIYERWLQTSGLAGDSLLKLRDDTLPVEFFSSCFENSHV